MNQSNENHNYEKIQLLQLIVNQLEAINIILNEIQETIDRIHKKLSKKDIGQSSSLRSIQEKALNSLNIWKQLFSSVPKTLKSQNRNITTSKRSVNDLYVNQ
eukprot:gb/GECH01009847.1/.p1 GENE.gb/GECH01009847.1/~~gb/GECH01009847.1/.p1  ORF type:complete len:102 (+),score=22.23 gb/GECH01009847.1/:1-306(+)